MTRTPATDWYQDDHDDYGEHVECYECGGEGGRASCMSDCCPFEGGEEACDEPACWRRCDVCDGKGGWTREEPDTSPPEHGTAHPPHEEKST